MGTKPVRGVRRAALWMNLRSALCYANNIFPKNAYGRGVSFRAKLLNGICHTIKTNAGRGTDAARVIGVASRDFERAEAYMRFAMASRHNEDDDAFLRDADAYCEENFGTSAH